MKLFSKRTPNKMANLFSVAVAGAILSSPIVAQATVIDWTNQSMNQIDSYNTSTGLNTVVDGNAQTPDSMIFTSNGNNIIYGSNPSTGSNLYIYNIAAKTNTILASGTSLAGTNLGGPISIRDLALTPSGNSVLVSSYNGSTVYKVNIITGAVSTLASGSLPQGIVFTPSGNLFLNLGAGIEQINSSTGAVIQSNTTNGSLDGLTYDPTTGFLYATDGTASKNGTTIFQINPTTLAETALTISGTGVPTSLNLDGIEATQNGNLILANYSNNMLEYFTATNTTTVLASTAGIDDVAPLVGGGSGLTGTPEPGTFALFGTGILAMALFSLYSRRKAESC